MGNKRIIVMTQSAKKDNKCVAGIDMETGKWVRIVSDDEDTRGALTDDDLMYEDETQCQVLDIVDVPIVKKVPTKIQPENILLDREYYIEKVGRATLDDVLGVHASERHSYIFLNDAPSVKKSYFDEHKLGYSLMLVKVKDLVFSREKNRYNNLKLKATFVYNGVRYEHMSVTDPNYYHVRSNTKIRSAYLVVSLGEPYGSSCYKFIAKIFRA